MVTWTPRAPSTWVEHASSACFTPPTLTFFPSLQNGVVRPGHREHLQRSAELMHNLACRHLEYHARTPAYTERWDSHAHTYDVPVSGNIRSALYAIPSKATL